MHLSLCRTCRAHLKHRLRERILSLQLQRQSYHAAPTLRTDSSLLDISRSWYWDTAPPTSEGLDAATAFFREHPPRKLWTATEWRKQNEPTGGTLVPEVAFLGRSNVGKSSLLNALLLTPRLNHVGPRPGKTTTMHAWGLSGADPVTGGAVRGRGGDMDVKIAVLDMPGYGHASHGDWGQEIITYLRRRKQLKRAFILLDALHGVKASDVRMLQLLRKESIPHQVIASKIDRLSSGKTSQTVLAAALWKMRNAVQPKGRAGGFVGLGEILTVGALGDGRKNDHVKQEGMIGLEQVRYAALAAAGLEAKNSRQLLTPPEIQKFDSLPVDPQRRPPSPATDHKYVPTGMALSSGRFQPFHSPQLPQVTTPSSLEQSSYASSTSNFPSLSSETSEQERKPLRIVQKPILTAPASKPDFVLSPDSDTNASKQAASSSATSFSHTSHSTLAAQDTAQIPRKRIGSVGYGLKDLFAMTAAKPRDGGAASEGLSPRASFPSRHRQQLRTRSSRQLRRQPDAA